MNKTKTIAQKLFEVGEKYGFDVKETPTQTTLYAKTTDGAQTWWISHDKKSDLVSILGNTDNCNIWLCDTRKDMTPEKCIEFVRELNEALEMTEESRIRMKDIIDPEDWQEIANVSDASEDGRYKNS